MHTLFFMLVHLVSSARTIAVAFEVNDIFLLRQCSDNLIMKPYTLVTTHVIRE